MSADPFDPELQRFVRDHARADPARLVLDGTPPGIDARVAAEQILARLGLAVLARPGFRG